jgi:pimeloyl-ACP methyl ester carboxylesterase
MHGWREDIAVAARLPQSTGESLLHIFFADTEMGRARGREFLGRFMAPRAERDTLTTLAARDDQYDATVEWGIPDLGALQRLAGIRCPTLIIQDDDQMIPDEAQPPHGRPHPRRADPHLPGLSARLPLQEPAWVADDVSAFLARMPKT